MSQRQRTRSKEKLRRDDLKVAIEQLHDYLLQHDDNFRRESDRRTSMVASSVRTARRSTANGQEHLAFTKVEIINQAIFTIQATITENEELNAATRSDSATGESQPATRVASIPSPVFHQGVGPLNTNPASTNQNVHVSDRPASHPNLRTSSSLSRNRSASRETEHCYQEQGWQHPGLLNRNQGHALRRDEAALHTLQQRALHRAAIIQQQDVALAALNSVSPHSGQHRVQRNQALLVLAQRASAVRSANNSLRFVNLRSIATTTRSQQSNENNCRFRGKGK